MSDFFDNKFDLLIIIVLSLLVAFIIGFNIIQLVDNKLNAVTINVPPNALQPIYLNIDKDNKLQSINITDNIKITDNININEVISAENKMNFDFEEFGNLPDYASGQSNSNVIASVINQNDVVEQQIDDTNGQYETQTDPNYNTVNNMPLLFTPDPPTPNQVTTNSPAYYTDRVKLISNPDSPLLKLNNKNMENIQATISKCKVINNNIPPKINGTFDGYNTYANLRNDSYANVTSIGKSMLTPFTSYPVPS